MIYIASDHKGYQLKKTLMKNSSFEWKDLGTFSEDSTDYPDFADKLAKELKSSKGKGVLICGSGQGMAMRANKYDYIRAALCWNKEISKLSREHNDANVLVLGASFISEEEAEECLQVFMNTAFEEGRHTERVKKLSKPMES